VSRIFLFNPAFLIFLYLKYVDTANLQFDIILCFVNEDTACLHQTRPLLKISSIAWRRLQYGSRIKIHRR
jgi:hypothetical protein